MSSDEVTLTTTVLLMGLNFTTSVVIIWLNKIVFNSNFNFAISLTILHFAFTFLGLLIAAKGFNYFEIKRINPVKVLPISLAFCGFVIFNNLSLQYNPVGVYQLLKVMTTPVIVALQWFIYKSKLPFNQMIALIPICIGVILATVTNIDVNFWGLVYGVLGIFSTSFYQIWVKTEQESLNLNSQQLLFYQAPMSCLILCICVPFLENLWDGPDALFNKQYTGYTLFFVLASSVCAFLVNLSIFLVIKCTSPVSYNVLGHGKLCVILVSGYVLFHESCNFKNIVGITFTVWGIIWYTNLKLAAMKLTSPSRKQTSAIAPPGTTGKSVVDEENPPAKE